MRLGVGCRSETRGRNFLNDTLALVLAEILSCSFLTHRYLVLETRDHSFQLPGMARWLETTFNGGVYRKNKIKCRLHCPLYGTKFEFMRPALFFWQIIVENYETQMSHHQHAGQGNIFRFTWVN